MDAEARAGRDGSATIFLIEDDPGVAMTLIDVLESEGYGVIHAASGAAAKALIDEARPDLVILDLMLPDTDGLVLCADLKSRITAPIIICSATNRKRDAVLGFKLGADDFISKPFHIDELLTRVQAAIRRSVGASRRSPEPVAPAPQAVPATATAAGGYTGSALSGDGQTRNYEVGNLSVDHARRNVKLGGMIVDLTPTEYRLVVALASRPEEVLSRQDLAQIVWGYQDASIGRSIDVHLHRLRTKLKAGNPDVTPPHIVSVRGFGYKITREEGEVSETAA